jgi:hypothetical protein
MVLKTVKSLIFLAVTLLSHPLVYGSVLSCANLFESNTTKLSPDEIVQLNVSDLKIFLDKPTFKGENLSDHPWIKAKLTNPTNHNPNDFMYVIHGVREGVPQELPKGSRGPYISASLISNNYVTSHARFGYILDVTAENIIATWPVDGQTRRDEPWNYRQTQGVHSQKDLLDRSGWMWQNHRELLKIDIYNEVLLDSGKTSPPSFHKVKTIGLYVIVDKSFKKPGESFDRQAFGWDGPLLSDVDFAAAVALAKKHNLPLIKLYRTEAPPMVDRRN